MAKLKEKRIDRRVETLEAKLRAVHAILTKLAEENKNLTYEVANRTEDWHGAQEIIRKHAAERVEFQHTLAKREIQLREVAQVWPVVWENWDAVKELLKIR